MLEMLEVTSLPACTWLHPFQPESSQTTCVNQNCIQNISKQNLGQRFHLPFSDPLQLRLGVTVLWYIYCNLLQS
jgi:hypothetical protein